MFNFCQIPGYFLSFFNGFRDFFTKPQFSNFSHFVSGFILSERRNIQEINSIYGDKNQSSLNRFVTGSTFDLEEVNSKRLEIARDSLGSTSDGLLILDDTMAVKTGKKMEKANFHRSGVTKQKEWGHCFVDTIYAEPNSTVRYPVNITSYLRKMDSDKEHQFKTKRDIALEHIDLSISKGIKAKTVMADAWYYSREFLKELKNRRLKYFIGVKSNVKISLSRKERISIQEYLATLKEENYSQYQLKNGIYFIHSKEITVRGIGKQVLLVSYKKGEEKNVKCYFTNNFQWTNDNYINILIKRWNIECFHRDMKQHLGLEEYQVRKYRGMQVVALAMLLAYTLLVLNVNHRFLKKLRPLKTIGEMCRFAKLYAQRSTYWMKKNFADPSKGAKIANQLVFVKNAKV